MNIASPAFENGASIPLKYTCDGKNVNPPLVFQDVPKEAVSLVLIMDDPDSPSGTWNHWTAWNMSPARTAIAEGETGEWVEGTTTFGNIGYGGPCPGSGTHRYFFKLYALDTTLSLPKGSVLGDLVSVMEGHIIAKAELMGKFEKQHH